MFEVLIEQLLGLQAKLESEKQARIEQATQEIEQEFAENAVKIQNALDEFGYVKPQEVEETQTETEIESNNQEEINLNY